MPSILHPNKATLVFIFLNLLWPRRLCYLQGGRERILTSSIGRSLPTCVSSLAPPLATVRTGFLKMSSHCAYLICFRDCLLHSQCFPISCLSLSCSLSCSLCLPAFLILTPAQRDCNAPAHRSWQCGTLHYAAAHPCTSALSEVVLHSVGCQHENVLFLFRHRFELCSVDFCSFRSEAVVYPLSVIKIWTNLTAGSRVTPCLVNPSRCES